MKVCTGGTDLRVGSRGDFPHTELLTLNRLMKIIALRLKDPDPSSIWAVGLHLMERL